MSPLTLVSVNHRRPLSASLLHDLRNVVATVGLHLETLERLAGPPGGKAASAAQALVARAGLMCSEALQEAARPGPSQRGKVDIVKVVRRVVDMLAPIAPPGLSLEVHADGAVVAAGNAEDMFRILFNLAHNAVMVAARTGRMSRVAFAVARTATAVTVDISDDGPGLPDDVRADLFARPRGDTVPRHGHGLAIARELAEHNGGTLQLAAGNAGTKFRLVLAASATVQDGPVTRLLG